jgi:uncharacterized membrane protein YccC
MLLRNRLSHWQSWIAVGQFCLVVGLFGLLFLRPEADFWHGFVAGLCGTLIGTSVVFNLRGLVLRRRRQEVR